MRGLFVTFEGIDRSGKTTQARLLCEALGADALGVSEVILPALAEDRVVVSDRFLDSSLAYQGGARGLGIEDVERVNRFATRALRPDVTFLLEIDPAEAAARAGERDRFEEEGATLQEAVMAAYQRLIELEPGRWRRIDAARSPEEIHAEVLAEVEAARSGATA